MLLAITRNKPLNLSNLNQDTFISHSPKSNMGLLSGRWLSSRWWFREPGSFDLQAPPYLTYDFQGTSNHGNQTRREKEHMGSNMEGCVPGPEVEDISTIRVLLAKAQSHGCPIVKGLEKACPVGWREKSGAELERVNFREWVWKHRLKSRVFPFKTQGL